MIERQIEIQTVDGHMNTFICHPERSGPFPVVVLFMDAPGIREELRDFARRMGAVGYYVLLPNLYYRSGVEELGQFLGEAGAPTRAKMMSLKDSLSISMVMGDLDALISFAEQDTAASNGAIGCVGYCMSGQYAINAAVRNQRVRAAASIYGVALVTDQPDSPHLAVTHTDARLYFGIAEIDDYVPTSMIEQLQSALKGVSTAEIEVYPGMHHAFAFPQRPSYNKAAAEKHWERLFELFTKQLK